jgi:hypothetical protein
MRKGNSSAQPGGIPNVSGSPLPPDVRAKMEPRLGGSLEGVRIHAGSESAQAAAKFGARAFTVGQDVHFNAGQFAPGSKEGDKLLAHELCHVVQGQRAGVQRKTEAHEDESADGANVSQPGEPAEVEADAVSEEIASDLHDGGSAEKHDPSKGERGAVGEKAPVIGAKLEAGTVFLARDTVGNQSPEQIRSDFAKLIAELQVKSQIRNRAELIPHLRAKFNKAEDDRQRQQVMAEGRRVLAVCNAGAQEVYANARANQQYTLGGRTITINPLSESDVLYLDGAGQIRIDEVAHVAHALREKVNRTNTMGENQFKNLVDWRRANPGVEIQYVVDHEHAWTEIFGRSDGEARSTAQQLIANNITLVIGNHTLTSAALRELYDAIEARFVAYKKAGRCNSWREYFALMPTVAEARRIAGSPPPPSKQ